MKRNPRSGADAAAATTTAAALDRQRIDKWLWHARLVRTRTAAASLAAGGCVRLNGERIAAASRKVAAGDVVTIAFDPVRVWKVLSFSERRGGAESARALYEDLSPKPQPGEPALPPRKGGRPTKRDRRAIDRLTDHNDI